MFDIVDEAEIFSNLNRIRRTAMGRFIEEMTRLREDVNTLSNERKAFINNLGKDVAELKSDTAEMQARFRNDHREMAEAEKKKRGDFLNGLTTHVSEMQTGFRRERKENADKSIKELNEFMSDIRTFVSDLGSTVSQMQEEFDKNRTEMASNLRTDLQKAIKNTTDAVSGLKAETLEMQETFRKNFAQASKENRESRTAFLTYLKKDVENSQRTFNKERFATAEKMKDDFARTAKGLTQFVSDLGSKVYHMQNEFRETHEDMAREGRKERQAFIADIVRSVADLKGQVAQFRKAFGDDLAGARAIWSSKKKIVGRSPETSALPFPEESAETAAAPPFPEEPVKTAVASFPKESVEIAPSPSQPEEKATTAPAVDMDKKEDDGIEAEKNKPEKKTDVNLKKKDDLTYITGIGPGRLKQLNASGIFTFKQLGDSTPEALRELLGESSRLVDVKKWIEQARDFS